MGHPNPHATHGDSHEIPHSLPVLAAAFLSATNVFAVPQIVTVSVTGSGADYSSIVAALKQHLRRLELEAV